MRNEKVEKRKPQVYHSLPGEVFHVHTRRCGHAGEEEDICYVKKAIELNSPRIVFTDHAPFPDDPFGNRMAYDQLPEYIGSINDLAKEYKDQIEILCGLEVEYLPSYKDYISGLRNMEGIDLLIIGQHFYEKADGGFSFSDEDKSEEYQGLCDAMVEGMKTGMFDVAAHPDRAFRRKESLTRKEIEAMKNLIWTAAWEGIYLEKNYSSMQKKHQYWKEFWKLLPPKARIIYGIDAHSTEEIEDGYRYYKEHAAELMS